MKALAGYIKSLCVAGALSVLSLQAYSAEGRFPLVLGELSDKSQAAKYRDWLMTVEQNTGFSPTAKRLLEEWRHDSSAADPAIRIMIVPFRDRGHAGKSEISVSDSVKNPVELTSLLAHEWLGHLLMRRQLKRMTGADPSGFDSELLGRVRGWRVMLELDPGGLDQDDEFLSFLHAGPSRYEESLFQPDRVYGLQLRLEEMRKPEAALAKRIAAIKGWLGAHPSADRSVAEFNLQLASSMKADRNVMTKWKRTAENPSVQKAAERWNSEIREFCDWARESRHMEGRCP